MHFNTPTHPSFSLEVKNKIGNVCLRLSLSKHSLAKNKNFTSRYKLMNTQKYKLILSPIVHGWGLDIFTHTPPMICWYWTFFRIIFM